MWIIWVYVYAYIYVNVYVCVRVHVRVHIHTHVNVYMCVYVCVCGHTHLYKHKSYVIYWKMDYVVTQNTRSNIMNDYIYVFKVECNIYLWRI